MLIRILPAAADVERDRARVRWLGLAAEAAAHGVLPPGGFGARLGPPFGHPGEPRLDELEALEEAQHVRQRPEVSWEDAGR